MTPSQKRIVGFSVLFYALVIGLHAIDASDPDSVNNQGEKKAKEAESAKAASKSNAASSSKQDKEDAKDDAEQAKIRNAQFDENQGKQNFSNFSINDYKNSDNVGKSVLIPSAAVGYQSGNSAMNVDIENTNTKMDGQNIQAHWTESTTGLKDLASDDNDNSYYELKAIITGYHDSGIQGVDGKQPAIEVVGYQKVGNIE